MKIEIGDDDSDKFAFSVGKDFGQFVFLISQFFQSCGYFFLIFKGQ
mgnify:CR=1 FL=1